MNPLSKIDRCWIVWNGPTILGKEARGSRIFFRVLACYVAHLKAEVKSEKIFFFLMSEGFKSYLFCYNNFPIFYPNPFSKIPQLESLLIDKVGEIFGKDDYNKENQLIKYEEGEGLLLEDKISIESFSDEIKKLFEFYRKMNPQNGDYLCCIAECNDQFFAQNLISLMEMGDTVSQSIYQQVHAQFIHSSL
jgi:hypothetical protein